MKIIRLFIFLLLLSSKASATVGWSFGYNGTVMGNGIGNIRNEVYMLNCFDYPNLSKPFEFNNFFRGFNLDVIFNFNEEKEMFYF
jgi:hypothetical protein